jgi:hypothetical protein
MTKPKYPKPSVRRTKNKTSARSRSKRRSRLKDIQKNPDEYYEWEGADNFEKFRRK